MELLDKIDACIQENSPIYLKMAYAEIEKLSNQSIVHPRDTVWFKTIRQIAQRWSGQADYTPLLSLLVEWWERTFKVKTNWPKQ